jgi:hypothetical protein
MIRLLLRLFGIKDFEVCQSCETLKQQLVYERDNSLRLTATLINIVNPKTIEAAPVEINPISQTSTLFSKRRAALEARDRIEAQILAEKKHIGVPDKSIENLEKELGINGEAS